MLVPRQNLPMSRVETTPLARPLVGMTPPPAKPLSFWKRALAPNGNPFETIPLAAYEEGVYAPKSSIGRFAMVHDPEGLRHVLAENVVNYRKSEMDRQFFTAMLGDGLLSSEGVQWRRHRKIMSPAFDPRMVAGYAPQMLQAARVFADRWNRMGSGTEVDIAAEMHTLTMDVLCRTLFSSDAEELAELAGPAVRAAQDNLAFGVLDLMPVIGPMRIQAKLKAVHEIFARLDTAIYRTIAAREKNLAAGPRDLLSRLLEARDEEGKSLSPNEVRNEMITIFVAGHETMSVAMTFVWYLLSQHPTEEAKLHAELDMAFGGRMPSGLADTPLPYTRMVIEEAMRLYPPLPGLGTRTMVNDDTICGVELKAGTRIIIYPWVLHRHRKLWDNPERFDPERFSPEQSVGRSRFAFLPFGAGPRTCIGAAFAMQEAVLILATLAQLYRVTLVEGQNIQLQCRVTLRPRAGIRMRLGARAAARSTLRDR
jgi:cytochrome P450